MFVNSSINIKPIVRKVSPVVLAIAWMVIFGCGEFPCFEGDQIDGIDVIGKGSFFVSINDDLWIADKATHLYERKRFS